MWIGLGIGVLIGGGQLVKAFLSRHEPEPPNNRLKLPIMLLLLGGCIALAVSDEFPVLFAALALLIAVEIPFILAGRNPWWMQAPIDKREYQSSHELRRARRLSLP
jgi:hypothetical protein